MTGVIRPLTVDTVAAAVVDGGTTWADTPVEFLSPRRRETVALAELVDTARRVAAGLRSRGLGSGDRIVTLLPNGRAAVEVQFAAALIGAVLVPVLPVLGVSELRHVLDDADPAFLVTTEKWRRHELAERMRLAAGERADPMIHTDAEGWADLAACPPLDRPEPARPGDICLVIYTSGSTGVPKGVRHTHRGVLTEAMHPSYRATMTPADLALQTSAAGHIGGYLYPLRVLLGGSRTIVLDGWDPGLAAHTIAERRVSALPATPFHLAAILDIADRDGLDVSSLAYVVLGGAPCPPGLIERADHAGVRAVRAYGMSEHPTITLGDHRLPAAVRARSDGAVVPGSEVRLVDDRGRVVEPVDGAVGEVETRGIERFAGYTNADPRSLPAEEWFATGDIARLDAGGTLTVVDRKKNIIVRGGENLSPTEIELVLSQHPAVAEVAVVGVPDDRYGERACAFVVLRPGTTLDLAAVRRHFAAAEVGVHKTPEHLVVLDDLPRSAIQKVRRAELRQLFVAGAAPAD